MAETVTTHKRRSSRAWWLVLLLVAVGAVAAAVVLIQRDADDTADSPATPSVTSSANPSPRATQPQAHRVTQFAGEAGTTTQTFTVALNWEIRWAAPSGSGFAVELLRQDGTSRGQVVQAGTKASGSTFVGEAGEFKLKVTSSKPWTIQIFSRPLSK